MSGGAPGAPGEPPDEGVTGAGAPGASTSGASTPGTGTPGANTSGPSALERLAALLREQGGLLATLLAGEHERAPENGDGPPGPAQTVAAGTRARHAPQEYELLMEAIYEGYLLHYGAGRVVRPPEADMRLLAGDRLYALGLARLVALGDGEAVAELADTITLSALAQAAGQEPLAKAVWEAGARAVGWGSSEAHRRAKRLAFAGSPEAIEAMRTSAAGGATPA